MINHATPRTAKPDALTTLLRSDLPDLGEIQVERVENAAGEADALTLYMNQAAGWPRLEAAEELRLGRLIRAGRQPDGSLSSAGQAALQELICRNLRLPVHAALQVRVPREELLELISAGNAALHAAAVNFDAELGHRFSTYAYWGIRAAVLRELNFLRRTVRLPRNLHEQMSRLRKAEAALRQERGEAVGDADLAAVLGCSPEKVVELRAYHQHAQSLDAPVAEDGDLTFGETLADEDAAGPAGQAEAADRTESLRECLAQLTPRELEVIRLRHGLDGEEHTLDAIGRRQGVSRERIRQIEAGAIRKLRLGIRT